MYRKILFQDAFIYGNVKSIKEISFKAKEKNGHPTKIKRWRKYIGEYYYDFKVDFDLKGNMIRYTHYPTNDPIPYDTSELYYKYNNKGQLIEIYHPDYENNSPEYVYDNRGLLVKQIFSSDSYLEYKYDANMALYQENQITNETEEFIDTYLYENGFIKFFVVYYTGAKWYIIYEYQRDDDGNVTKFRSDGNPYELKTEKWYECEYEFDEMGNWTKCLMYRSKKLVYIMERTIEYY